MRPVGDARGGSAYRVARVATLAQLEDAARIRFAVYADAMALPRSVLPALREINGYDLLDTTENFVCYHGDEAVGTLRFMRPNPCLAGRHGVRLGLPIEIQYRVENLPDMASIAEVGRAAIVPAHRGSIAIGQLYRTVYEASLRRGISHWIGMSVTETDMRDDALIMAACLRRQGRAAPAPCFFDRVAEAPGYRPQRAFYTPDERLTAGDGRQERLPRTVRFLLGMGCTFVGDPVFEPAFKEFMLPVLLPLDGFAGSPLGRRFLAERRAA